MISTTFRAAATAAALTASLAGAVAVDAAEVDTAADTAAWLRTDDVGPNPDPARPSTPSRFLMTGTAHGSGEEGSCLQFPDVNTLYDEHETTLVHYNSNGVPSGKEFDLVWELCRRKVDGGLTAGQVQSAKDSIDLFIGVLQEHFETRDPQTWESSLTDCYVANGTTYTVPLGIDPAADLPPYQPIIGYQLAFDQDPRITVFVHPLGTDAAGAAFTEPFPVDPSPDPYRGLISLNEQFLAPYHVDYISGTIAHELGHRIGYMHKPEYDGDDSPLVYALGNCVRDAHAQGQALPEFSAELPDSGHGGEAPAVLSS